MTETSDSDLGTAAKVRPTTQEKHESLALRRPGGVSPPSGAFIPTGSQPDWDGLHLARYLLFSVQCLVIVQ